MPNLTKFINIFNQNSPALIGMLHLKALPGLFGEFYVL